jgi:hypothetical protein
MGNRHQSREQSSQGILDTQVGQAGAELSRSESHSVDLAALSGGSWLPPTTSAFELMAELGRLAGESVELLERRISSGPVFMVMPVDRSRCTAPFWRAVQADPTGGFWDSAEQAVVGFAAGVAGWVAKAELEAATGLPAALRARLQAGPQPAAEVLAAFAANGISSDRLGRAARRMGVKRFKTGMAGGWMWALPLEGSEGGAKSAKAATLESHHE